ncbi:MAG: DNA primase [Candidatus Azotimanducaceae bacterium]|jgi:DNA primase
MIPKEIIDVIFETTRIEEVIGEFVNLKKAGANYKGLSPFTPEKTPSFVVSPAKQIFKCFSTGKGGSAVTFLMEHEHFSYPEALRYLANKYGIEIPEREMTAEERAFINEKESLFLVSEAAQKFFENTLWEEEEGKAIGLSYLKERDISEKSIKTFGLGYSPNKKDAFTTHAERNGYKLTYLEKTGLTLEGKKIDRFYGRVTFPIHSISGRILGFGGRILKTNVKAAKYLNSPESEIYHKSKVLYGLFQAKKSIIKEDRCFLVEGYTDVISLHQHGIENVVASSGTALTNDQIRLIRRLTPNITILYDGDAAGLKAAFRGIDLVLAEGMHVKVVQFAAGEDPDTFARSVSNEELQRFLNEQAQDFISFKSNVLLEDAGNDPVKRAGLIKQVLESIAVVDDNTLREVYIKDTASRFDMTERNLTHELDRLRGNKLDEEYKTEQRSTQREQNLEIAYSKEQQLQTGYPDEEQERKMISLLLNDGEAVITLTAKKQEEESGEIKEVEISSEVHVAHFIVQQINQDDLKFDNPIYQQIYNDFAKSDAISEVLPASFFTRHEDSQIVHLVSDLITEIHQISPSWGKFEVVPPAREKRIRKDVLQSIFYFKQTKLQRLINGLQDNLKKSENGQEIMAELIRFNEIKIFLSKLIEQAR